jgi:transcription-repair coupling factor (superfamily II helicase)
MRAKTGSIAAGANCWRRPTKSRIWDMEQRRGRGGHRYYLPLFFEETATVFDYTSARTPRWCCTATCSRPSSASGRDTNRYRLVKGSPDRPAPLRQSLFLR